MSRPKTPWSVWIAALCLCTVAAALCASTAWAQGDQRALLSLSVNQTDQGEVLVVLRGADVLVEVAVLERAGLRGLAGRRETIDTRAFVSLASLAPAIRFSVNEEALSLSITADLSHLAARTLDLSTLRPSYQFSRATSAFLNYGGTWYGNGSRNGAIESGVSFGAALAQTTLAWDRFNGLVRGVTSVVFDERERLRRWTLGDGMVPARLFGSGLLLGGVHVAREYGLDPYFIQFPSLGLSGNALTPSTVEVYVNDRLVSREQVAPGTFTLQNVPLTSGTNNTRVVVRDAFGREQSTAAPFYLTTTVLARGLHDYDYAIGYPRVGGVVTNWTYGNLSAIARHRYGFTDRLTAGVVAEADAHTQVLGPTINYRLGVGELEVAASGSTGRNGSGGALAAGYAYMGHPVAVSVRLRSMSADFSTLTVQRPTDRVRMEASGMVASRIGRHASASLQQSYAETHAGELRAQTTVSANVGIGRHLNLFVNASRIRDGSKTSHDLFAGLSIPLAARTDASVWAHGGDGQSGVDAEVRRSLPLGSGYGYRARAALGDSNQGEAVVEAQNRYGRYEAGQEILNGESTAHASFSGGLVAIGGRVIPTRSVVDSFALVRVPDVGGVRTYLNNQEIGRTDRHGDLLMSNLLPYYANRIAIADQDVPLERSIETVEQAVAPPFRGGTLVTFRASERRTATGTVMLSVGAQSVMPSLGELSVSIGNENISSPIGRNGEFYLEGVRAGRHPAVVEFGATRCQFDLTIPQSDNPIQRLGVIRCVVPEAK